jgi:hypothetical protein
MGVIFGVEFCGVCGISFHGFVKLVTACYNMSGV